MRSLRSSLIIAVIVIAITLSPARATGLLELLTDGFEIKAVTMENLGSGDKRMWIVLQNGKRAAYCSTSQIGNPVITKFEANSFCVEFAH
jgi:hypothetical protein